MTYPRLTVDPQARVFLFPFNLKQFLPHHRQVLGSISAQTDLIPLDAKNDDLDQLSCGQFNDDSFAGAAGDDEHGNLLLPAR